MAMKSIKSGVTGRLWPSCALLLVPLVLLAGCIEPKTDENSILPPPDRIYIWPSGTALRPGDAGYPELVESVNRRIPPILYTSSVKMAAINADHIKKNEVVLEFAYKETNEVEFIDQNGAMNRKFTNIFVTVTPVGQPKGNLMFFADNTGVLPAATLDYEALAFSNLADSKPLLQMVRDVRAGKIKKRESTGDATPVTY